MSDIYASIDLGGTNIKCCLAGRDGKVLAKKSMPTESQLGPEGVIKRIAVLVNSLSEEAGVRPVAAGMGVPGLCDLPNGLTKFLPNMPTQWRDISVRGLLEPQINCPVYLLNDVRIATLGELTFGHGRTAATMVFYALGTGIGGGVVIDGKLRMGAVGAAGEIGHQTILPGGALCGCGNRGCLETLASGPAITAAACRLMLSGLSPILHEITDGSLDKVNCKTVEDAARAGDKNVMDVVTTAGRYLGIGMANMVVALHPDLIVIGGGVSLFGDILIKPAVESMRASVHMLPTDDIRVETSMLRDQAGALGGIALAMKGGNL